MKLSSLVAFLLICIALFGVGVYFVFFKLSKSKAKSDEFCKQYSYTGDRIPNQQEDIIRKENRRSCYADSGCAYEDETGRCYGKATTPITDPPENCYWGDSGNCEVDELEHCLFDRTTQTCKNKPS